MEIMIRIQDDIIYIITEQRKQQYDYDTNIFLNQFTQHMHNRVTEIFLKSFEKKWNFNSINKLNSIVEFRI